MKQLLYILLAVTLFTACSSDDDNDIDNYTTYRYQIVNKSEKDINSITFYSYKEKSKSNDSDAELITNDLKIGESTKEYKTKYPYVSFEFLYYLDSWISESPILRPGEFPAKGTFFELEKDKLNIIELKSVY
ncbi:hypothetical protein E2605_07525 [Dysgonomonas capnocytophagoides]|uniref:Lipoprotein n=1 Tax=Dysgonomonas capnocytophagoides TaxID=45254 RepID=A0A4Y8L6G9_9BACT|nr:hypothetical protein [Dysgonomonas capnocytophagoides]TFD96660.1 hypothetical protein E2605_07525 [Dysgonomonas capnocytophagoides]